jgi:DNA repair exonuclease SbcCD nuclease subunit
MNNFLFTADIHLKNWNDKIQTEKGISLKLQEILDVFNDICEYSVKNKINQIIIGGDINDTKGIANTNAFAYFQDFLLNYSKIDFYIIPGNHDFGGKGTNKYAVDLLRGGNNIFVITETEVNENITFLPWKDQNLVNEINELEPNDILISHFGLDEAQLSSGISIRSGITSRMLTKFKTVLLGHYHKPQSLKEKQTEIYYSGSPLPLRRDEVNEEKRFLEIKIVDDEIKTKSISTKGYRKFYEFSIDENTDIENVKNKIEKLKDEGHYVVIRNNTKNIPKELEETVQGTQFIQEFEDEYEKRGITSSMKLEEQLKKWCEFENISEDDISKYVKIGLYAALGENMNE